MANGPTEIGAAVPGMPGFHYVLHYIYANANLWGVGGWVYSYTSIEAAGGGSGTTGATLPSGWSGSIDVLSNPTAELDCNGTVGSFFQHLLPFDVPTSHILYNNLPPGVSFISTNCIQGVPTAAGSFGALVTDGAQTQNLRIIVNIAAAVPVAYSLTVGTAFSQSAAAGSITAGTLPPGISLAIGSFIGIPTTAGVYSVTITEPTNYSFKTFILTVAAAGTNLIVAVAGTTVNQTAVPGTITAGTLPTGVNLTGGNFVGTPAAAGNYPVTITDTNGAFKIFNITVGAPASIPIGWVTGTAVNQTAAPGTITAGALPPGVSLTGGSFVGTPTTAGHYSVTITATGGAIQIFSIQVDGIFHLWWPQYASINLLASGGSGSTFSAGTLPPGVSFSGGSFVGSTTQLGDYFPQILAVDYFCFYTITIVGTTYVDWPIGTAVNQAAGPGTAVGTLPPGVSLTGGSFVGIPTQTGTYNVSINDTSGSFKLFNISVLPATPVALSWAIGAAINQTAAPGSITTGTLPPGVSLTGGSFVGHPAVAGNYSVTITATNGAFKIFNITVGGTLPEFLAGWTLGIAVNQAAMTGAQLITGSLPPGVTLSGNNFVGTPNTPGTYSAVLAASDGSLKKFTFQVDVINSPVWWTAGGAVNQPAAVGSIVQGILPPGVALTGGNFVGTPSAPGVYSPVIWNQTGRFYTWFTINITGPTYLSWEVGTLVNQTAGSGTMTGTLPTGVNLSSGNFVGVPTQTGVFNVTVTDPSGSFKIFNITVGAATPHPLSWTAGTAVSDAAVGTTTDTLPPGVSFSGTQFTGVPTTTGSWTVKVTASDGTFKIFAITVASATPHPLSWTAGTAVSDAAVGTTTDTLPPGVSF